MKFPVFYFTMADGTKLRATFHIHGFSFVYIRISEWTTYFRWFSGWKVVTHPHSGDAHDLKDFLAFSAEHLQRWTTREATAWHEYSKVLKAYKP